jgi:Zn-dependent alcohol dehydrogenase
MRSEAPDLTRLAEVAERARPVALAREQVLPVLPPLETVLPGGLRRGSTVAIIGSTSLALAVLAGPVQAGSWVAAVGVSSLGLAAASELGVALDRLVLVADPRDAGTEAASWGTTIATLVDAFDAVLVRPGRRAKQRDARRLAARARERGSVLVVLGDEGAWPDAPDVQLSIERADWVGLGAGHGHLRARRVVVVASGRRGAARPRRADLWLPAAGGGIAEVETLAEVRPLRS